MIFSEEDRAIYRYHDGKSEVAADPLSLRRKLVQAAQGDLASLVRTASPPEPAPEAESQTLTVPGVPAATEAELTLARLEGEERLLKVIRFVFNLPEVDAKTGEGLTDACCWVIWDDFSRFVSGEKRLVGS